VSSAIAAAVATAQPQSPQWQQPPQTGKPANSTVRQSRQNANLNRNVNEVEVGTVNATSTATTTGNGRRVERSTTSTLRPGWPAPGWGRCRADTAGMAAGPPVWGWWGGNGGYVGGSGTLATRTTSNNGRRFKTAVSGNQNYIVCAQQRLPVAYGGGGTAFWQALGTECGQLRGTHETVRTYQLSADCNCRMIDGQEAAECDGSETCSMPLSGGLGSA